MNRWTVLYWLGIVFTCANLVVFVLEESWVSVIGILAGLSTAFTAAIGSEKFTR